MKFVLLFLLIASGVLGQDVTYSCDFNNNDIDVSSCSGLAGVQWFVLMGDATKENGAIQLNAGSQSNGKAWFKSDAMSSVDRMVVTAEFAFDDRDGGETFGIVVGSGGGGSNDACLSGNQGISACVDIAINDAMIGYNTETNGATTSWYPSSSQASHEGSFQTLTLDINFVSHTFNAFSYGSSVFSGTSTVSTFGLSNPASVTHVTFMGKSLTSAATFTLRSFNIDFYGVANLPPLPPSLPPAPPPPSVKYSCDFDNSDPFSCANAALAGAAVKNPGWVTLSSGTSTNGQVVFTIPTIGYELISKVTVSAIMYFGAYDQADAFGVIVGTPTGSNPCTDVSATALGVCLDIYGNNAKAVRSGATQTSSYSDGQQQADDDGFRTLYAVFDYTEKSISTFTWASNSFSGQSFSFVPTVSQNNVVNFMSWSGGINGNFAMKSFSVGVEYASISPSPPPPNNNGSINDSYYEDVESEPEGSSVQDPHLRLPYGGKTDFRGEENRWFAFLSAPSLSVNILIKRSVFTLNNGMLVVDGTFINKASIVTRLPGGFFNATFNATDLNDNLWSWRLVDGVCKGKVFSLGPHKKTNCGEIQAGVDMSSAVFDMRFFTVTMRGNRVYNRIDGASRRIDISIKATDPSFAALNTHGVLGQTFSFTTPTVGGEEDIYPASGKMTTTSQAGGVIAGKHTDYIVDGAYGTHFKFSKFDSTPLLAGKGEKLLMFPDAAEVDDSKYFI